MIPKIIHYCWLSNDEKPDLIKRCLATWQEKLPDFEFRLWDMEAVKEIDSIFMDEAISERKWAFAADVVRVYAVEKYGGIYLDSDVEIINSLEPLLHHRAFIGTEYWINLDVKGPARWLTSHFFGAEPHHPFLKECLSYYENRHFITSQNKDLPPLLRHDRMIQPQIHAELARRYGFNSSPAVETVQQLKEGLVVYPPYAFDANSRKQKGGFGIHYAAGSWRTDTRNSEPDRLPVAVPWWRRAIQHLSLNHQIEAILRKLGYIAFRIN